MINIVMITICAVICGAESWVEIENDGIAKQAWLGTFLKLPNGRASGRVLDKSHATILRWRQRLVEQANAWSPPAPEGSEVTLENDERYTRVGKNLPPSESEGWTMPKH